MRRVGRIRGLYWDARTSWVWAVGNVGAVSHVWAVDGDTGAIGYDRVIPSAVFLNDLVVTSRRVYVTDSRSDRLAVIGLGQNGRPTPERAARTAAADRRVACR